MVKTHYFKDETGYGSGKGYTSKLPDLYLSVQSILNRMIYASRKMNYEGRKTCYNV